MFNPKVFSTPTKETSVSTCILDELNQPTFRLSLIDKQLSFHSRPRRRGAKGCERSSGNHQDQAHHPIRGLVPHWLQVWHQLSTTYSASTCMFDRISDQSFSFGRIFSYHISSVFFGTMNGGSPLLDRLRQVVPGGDLAKVMRACCMISNSTVTSQQSHQSRWFLSA